jgi:hypothetical protein
MKLFELTLSYYAFGLSEINFYICDTLCLLKKNE